MKTVIRFIVMVLYLWVIRRKLYDLRSIWYDAKYNMKGKMDHKKIWLGENWGDGFWIGFVVGIVLGVILISSLR